jgi:hypothetical protein
VENKDSRPLSPVQIQWSGPDFLEFGRLVNSRCVVDSSLIALPAVPARSFASVDLCLHAKSVVVEGNFTVGVILLYGRNATAPSSYVLVEKSVSVGLFGNDAVAGVSLRLASFIVPGLLFFFLLQLGKVGALANLDSLKLSTLSVLFSFLLALVAAKLMPLSEARGVSVLRFAGLCGAAVALGLIVLGVNRIVHYVASRRAERIAQARVGPADDEATALAKAIAESKVLTQPIVLTLNDGRELIGSLSATTSDGGRALLGWFEVQSGGLKELTTLQQQKDYAGLLKLVTQKNIRLDQLNGIRERVAGNIGDVTGAPAIMRFPPAEIRSAVATTIAGIGETGPIEVR